MKISVKTTPGRWDIVDDDGNVYSVAAARELWCQHLADDVAIETDEAFDKLVELDFDAIDFDDWLNAA